MPSKVFRLPELTEHQLQAQVIQWARAQSGMYPPLGWLFAVPNGAKLPFRKNAKTGKRYSPEAMKLKAEGLTPGVADTFLPWAARGYFGFYIELKRPGKLKEIRPGQLEFLAWCEQAGYLAQVFDNFDDITGALLDYVTGPRTVAR